MQTLQKKLNKKEFRERADRILGGLLREVTGFEDTSAAARRERREKSLADPFFFFKTYLPHYFHTEEAPFHHELVEGLHQRPGPGEVVTPWLRAAPREFAKTTVCTFAYPLHQICLEQRHFIVPCSSTRDLASDLTGYMHLELLYNDRIRQDYGELVRANWAVDDFITLNDIRVLARGRGQALRGFKHKQWRPDLVILDDMEDNQSAKSPDRVKALLNWIKTTVYPAVESGRPGVPAGSLLWLGTILARKSAMDLALNGNEEPWIYWDRQIYRAIQADGTSLWPAQHPLEKLEKQRQMMGSYAFNTEKMNQPRNEEGMFREEWISYYELAEILDKKLHVVSWFDPSLETGSSSDYKAIVVVGLDAAEQTFYVLDAYIKKDTLDRALGMLFYLFREYHPALMGIEDNLFQRLLIREVERLEREMGQVLPIRGITNTANKESRVASLSALVERGKIRFRRGHTDQEVLIEQLLYFPSNNVHDDGPDALEGAVRLAQGGAGQGLFDFYKGEVEAQKAAEAAARGEVRLHG
jgi:predicted phage terminase large subunit-like protein